MRSSKDVQEIIDYFWEHENSPSTVPTLTLVAAMLFDIREILCLLVKDQGVDIDSLIVEAEDEADIQPSVDGADSSEDDLASAGELEVVDGVPVGSTQWFAKRKADLHSGFDDPLDSAGDESSSG